MGVVKYSGPGRNWPAQKATISDETAMIRK
jgi:hypothetical protein